MDIRQQIFDRKIVAIARNVPSKHILDLAKALYAGGIQLLEMTYDHSSQEGIQNALDSMGIISREMDGKLSVGAGTVMTQEQVAKAARAGARYIISPNMNERVIEMSKAMGLVSIPGAMTPTEIALAWETGADFVKVFPASSLGLAYFKAIRGPLPHIPLLATGGINAANLSDYLKAGCAGAGVGGNLVSMDLIKKGDFDAITKAAFEYTNVLEGM